MIRPSVRNVSVFTFCLVAVATGSARISGANPQTATRTPDSPTLVLRRGPGGNIEKVVFSPDSRLLATVGEDWTARVWQVSTGDLLASFPSDISYGAVLAFAPDNRTLITGGAQRRLDLCDAYTGHILRSITVAASGHVVAFSPNSSTLACSDEEGSIVLYDWRTGSLLRALQPHVGGWLSSIVFAGDDRILACAGNMSTSVEIWDAQAGRLIHTLETPGGQPKGPTGDSIALSPDGRILAVSGGMDPAKGSPVDLWDIESEKRLRTVRGDTFINKTLSFSADGTTLNIGGMSSGVKIYDVKTGELKSTIHENTPFLSNSVSPDGRLAAIADNEGNLRISDVKTGQALWAVPGDTHAIDKVLWPSHRDTLITTGGRKQHRTEVALWDARTGACAGTMTVSGDNIWDMAATPDGRTLIVRSLDAPLSLWNLKTGQRLGTIGAVKETATAIAVSPDGHTLAIVEEPPRNTSPKSGASSGIVKREGQFRVNAIKGSIDLWDLRTRKKLRTFSGVQGTANSLAFSPDGTTLYSAGGGSTVIAWNAVNGALRRKFASSRAATEVAVSPDGKWISDSDDGTAEVWNTRTAAHVFTFEPKVHEAETEISAQAFSPDSRLLVVARANGLAQILDLSTGKQVRALKGGGSVRSVAFSPHGEILATVDADSTLKWWDTRTGKLKAQSALLGPGNGNAPDWITYTPEGSYAGSDSAEKYIHLRVGNSTLPAAQSHTLNHPDRVQIALTGAPQSARFAELMRSERARRRTQAQGLAAAWPPQAAASKPSSSNTSPATLALRKTLSTIGGLGTDEDAEKMAAEIKTHLAAGANPRAQAYWGTTAMMVFAWVGDLPAVQDLVKRGVDVNTHDVYGGTALLHAAERGHEDIVQYLLAHGADLKDENGNSLLKLKGDRVALTAAMMRMLSTASRARFGRERNKPFDTEGTVVLLVDWGVDVNAHGEQGQTPLMLTSSAPLAKTLLEHGADPNARDERGNTVVVNWSISYSGTDLITMALDHGGDVNAVTNDGMSALMYAAQNGHVELAKLLLEHGADPNIALKPGDGRTALMLALGDGHLDIARLLIDHGAKVNTQNSYDGWSALTYAATHGDAEAVRLLLAHGADVNVRDKEGKSLLKVAAESDANAHDKFGVLALLKKAGAKE